MTGMGIIIDTRDFEDYQESHALNAIHLPYRNYKKVFPEFVQNISKQKSQLIYCHGTPECGLSDYVAKRLLVSGYADISVINMGISAWEQSFLPMERRDE